jgi:hypothetical protein
MLEDSMAKQQRKQISARGASLAEQEADTVYKIVAATRSFTVREMTTSPALAVPMMRAAR